MLSVRALWGFEGVLLLSPKEYWPGKKYKLIVIFVVHFVDEIACIRHDLDATT